MYAIIAIPCFFTSSDFFFFFFRVEKIIDVKKKHVRVRCPSAWLACVASKKHVEMLLYLEAQPL